MITAEDARENVVEAFVGCKGHVVDDDAIDYAVMMSKSMFDNEVRLCCRGGYTGTVVTTDHIERFLRAYFFDHEGNFTRCKEDYKAHIFNCTIERILCYLHERGYGAKLSHNILNDMLIDVWWDDADQSEDQTEYPTEDVIIHAKEARYLASNAVFSRGKVVNEREFVSMARKRLADRIGEEIAKQSKDGETGYVIYTSCIADYGVKSVYRDARVNITNVKEYANLVKVVTDDFMSYLKSLGYYADIRKHDMFGNDELYISWGSKE